MCGTGGNLDKCHARSRSFSRLVLATATSYLVAVANSKNVSYLLVAAVEELSYSSKVSFGLFLPVGCSRSARRQHWLVSGLFYDTICTVYSRGGIGLVIGLSIVGKAKGVSGCSVTWWPARGHVPVSLSGFNSGGFTVVLIGSSSIGIVSIVSCACSSWDGSMPFRAFEARCPVPRRRASLVNLR